MRFLHTADWHLGRAFHGVSLLSDQASFLEWLVDLAHDEKVDGVVIAGDLYDRALPPAEAVELAGHALQRLADGGRQVVVISGNHDSAPRLGFASSLLARAGLHVRTDPLGCGTPLILEGTAIYAIPYLEPDLVGARLGCDDRSHEAVLVAAMAQVHDDLALRPAGTTCVVAAHAFVAGATTADSERDITVGGAGQVGCGTFAGAHYVALGHLHRPQSAGAGRYAGSPLAYSFSEASDHKSVTIVEVVGRGDVRTSTVLCPVPRSLARLRGTLDELLIDPLHATHEDAWVEATLTDPVRPMDGMAQLQRRFPHAVSLLFDPQGDRGVERGSYAERLRGLTDDELVARFVLDVRGTQAEEDELALLREALSAGRIRSETV